MTAGPGTAPASGARVLVVDDETAHLEGLERVLAREGYDVLTAPDGPTALRLAVEHDPEVLVTDLVMPGMSGIELLKALRTASSPAEVVLMTAYGNVPTAVEAMKAGAYDFIAKPFQRLELVAAIERAVERFRLVRENRDLRERLKTRDDPLVIGTSPAFVRAWDVLTQAAPTDAIMLFLGESGTGKERFARAAHDLSPRAARPFVAVNCAALPETILEGELFGYEKGAFTGAVRRHDGIIAGARGGTLLLDEIGDMSPSVQAKLLRFLEDRRVTRLGSTRSETVDVRVLAATNQDLDRLVAAGRFREDLYWRLHAIVLRIPPLRERAADIPALVDAFLRDAALRHGRTIAPPAADVQAALVAATWRGNVRELRLACERAVVLARGPRLTAADFDVGGPTPGAVTAVTAPEPAVRPAGGSSTVRIVEGDPPEFRFAFGTPLEEIESAVIRETLARSGGDRRSVARDLGIGERTLYRRISELRGREG